MCVCASVRWLCELLLMYIAIRMNDFMFKLCIEIFLLCASQAYTTPHRYTTHHTLSLYRNPPENCAKTKRNDETKWKRDGNEEWGLIVWTIEKREKILVMAIVDSLSLCVSLCELKENERKKIQTHTNTQTFYNIYTYTRIFNNNYEMRIWWSVLPRKVEENTPCRSLYHWVIVYRYLENSKINHFNVHTITS